MSPPVHPSGPCEGIPLAFLGWSDVPRDWSLVLPVPHSSQTPAACVSRSVLGFVVLGETIVFKKGAKG